MALEMGCSTTQKDSSMPDNGKSDWRIMLHTYEHSFQTLQLAQWVWCVSGVVRAMDFSHVLCPNFSHEDKYLLDKRKKNLVMRAVQDCAVNTFISAVLNQAQG